jgi:hypothetical protein
MLASRCRLSSHAGFDRALRETPSRFDHARERIGPMKRARGSPDSTTAPPSRTSGSPGAVRSGTGGVDSCTWRFRCAARNPGGFGIRLEEGHFRGPGADLLMLASPSHVSPAGKAGRAARGGAVGFGTPGPDLIMLAAQAHVSTGCTKPPVEARAGFEGPSPDLIVLAAQAHARGLRAPGGAASRAVDTGPLRS